MSFEIHAFLEPIAIVATGKGYNTYKWIISVNNFKRIGTDGFSNIFLTGGNIHVLMQYMSFEIHAFLEPITIVAIGKADKT